MVPPVSPRSEAIFVFFQRLKRSACDDTLEDCVEEVRRGQRGDGEWGKKGLKN